jgi:hypothetical protein
MKLGAFVLLMSMLGADLTGTVGKGKVYVGPNGLEVTVLPLNKDFMIAVGGSGSVFDDRIISHELKIDGDRTSYQMLFHGRPWNTLTVRGDVVSLYVPGHRDGITLHYDVAKTAAFKPEPLLALLKVQQRDGANQFPYQRKTEIAEQEKQLQTSVDQVRKACGFAPTLQIDWPSISDQDFQQISVSSYCGEPLESMRQMCDDSSEAKRTLANKVKTFACTMGKSAQFGSSGTTLTWTTARNATNVGELTRAYLIGPLTSSGEAPPWGKGETLGERMALEKTAVCTDGKGHEVVVAPHDKQSVQLYYGDGKTFYRVPLPPWVLTGEDFFEPRFFAATKNPSFRGLDMRLYASVNYDKAKKTCSVSCGPRTTPLTLLDDEAKKALLPKADYQAPRAKRAPHRLARDEAGRYYYVDKGNTPETEKSFRLFVGPKGGMKLQKMTNAVADTEGEIFMTKSGSLRYVTDREKPPTWIQGKKKTSLTVVPIESVDEKTGEPINNYQLIYNELGVYLGERLGNPCDDL